MPSPAERQLLERERLLGLKQDRLLELAAGSGRLTPEAEALEVEADRERAELDAAWAERRDAESVVAEAEVALLSDDELRTDVGASAHEAERRGALRDALAEKIDRDP